MMKILFTIAFMLASSQLGFSADGRVNGLKSKDGKIVGRIIGGEGVEIPQIVDGTTVLKQLGSTPLKVEKDNPPAFTPAADTLGLFISGNDSGDHAAISIISNGAGGDGDSTIYLGDHLVGDRTAIEGGRSGTLKFSVESLDDAMTLSTTGQLLLNTNVTAGVSTSGLKIAAPSNTDPGTNHLAFVGDGGSTDLIGMTFFNNVDTNHNRTRAGIFYHGTNINPQLRFYLRNAADGSALSSTDEIFRMNHSAQFLMVKNGVNMNIASEEGILLDLDQSNDSAGNQTVQIRNGSNSPIFQVDETGQTQLYRTGSLYAFTVCYQNSSVGLHNISGCSSSLRNKTNVETIDDETIDKIHNLRAASFTWKEAQGGHEDYGLIAEEVYEHLPKMVDVDPETGEIQSVKYRHFTALLLAEIQRLRTEVDDLKLAVGQ